MNSSSNLNAITILNKEYRVKCPPEQVQQLHQAAAYLGREMQRLQQKNPQHHEELAIVAALNVCHEYLELKNQESQSANAMTLRIEELRKKIEKFLATTDEIAV